MTCAPACHGAGRPRGHAEPLPRRAARSGSDAEGKERPDGKAISLDGKLSPAEIKAAVCREMPGGKGLSEAQVDAVLNEYEGI